MHSDQVTRFLLGELPEGEMQRLQTALNEDEAFQQRVRIVEDDLVECFLRGQLKGDDLMRFRRFFLAHPERRERIKIAQGYLDDLNLTNPAKPALTTRMWTSLNKQLGLPPQWSFSIPKPLRSFWQSIYEPLRLGALATAFLAGLISFWLLVEYTQLRYQNYKGQAEIAEAHKNTQELTVELAQNQTTATDADERIRQLREQLNQTRAAALPSLETTASAATSAQYAAFPLQPSASNSNVAERQPAGLTEIKLPTGSEELLFQLDLNQNNSASYRVELRAQPDSQKVWESGTLKARTKEQGRVIEVRLPTAMLTPRAYTLRAFDAKNNDAETINYSFRVSAP